jgi:hypothetical protein
MIISTTIQTPNILVALMNYTVDPTDSMFNKFQFASFYLDESTIQNIKSFKNSFKSGRKYFQLTQPVTLVESDYIYDQTINYNPDFEHIKLDSISFLKVKPTFENITILDVIGGITCYPNYFTVDIDLNNTILKLKKIQRKKSN